MKQELIANLVIVFVGKKMMLLTVDMKKMLIILILVMKKITILRYEKDEDS